CLSSSSGRHPSSTGPMARRRPRAAVQGPSRGAKSGSPPALVLHQLQGHPERRLRHREDEVDLVGLELPLQEDASACQFGLGVFEVVYLNSDMADDRSLAIHELGHAETSSADLNQL